MKALRSLSVFILLVVASLMAMVISVPSEARVTRLVVEDRKPFAGGANWGKSGLYERLTGTAYMEVDPRDPLNIVIVDLDKAPRNQRGMVEYSTQFMIIKPVDMSKGNEKIYYTANNRGNEALLAVQTADQVNDEIASALRTGYTIVDAGWLGEVIPAPNKLVAFLPVATQADGSPIVGWMRVEYTNRNLPTKGTTYSVNLEGNPNFRSYQTTDTNTEHASFTVRDDVHSPKTPIPANRWAFGKCPNGQSSLTASDIDICYFDGFRLDKVYELIYKAKNPMVMGLGHAATRDLASFLRYEPRDTAGNPNPLAPSSGPTGILRSYATGLSQTGGYLRDYIYLGFNEDESHRKVFDGIMPTAVGTDRVFITVRFANPNIWSDQDDRHDFLQSSYPPFTYAVTTDPISGIRDGIMKRPKTDPLVFQLDSAAEFWQLRASLNVADGLGNPVQVPNNVRLYFSSSTTHAQRLTGVGTPPATAKGEIGVFDGQDQCQNLTASGPSATLTALLNAMDAWADKGIEPPKSNYARIEDGTLIPLEKFAQQFPKIPGVKLPTVMNQLEFLNFGPEFGQYGGVLTLQPPLLGASYKMFVPKTDEDGQDVAGVRPLQIRVPLGTNTGWNLLKFRPANLCGLSGSYFPFAETKAARLTSGDPRKSLEERYKDHEGLVKAVKTGTAELVRERFLLEDDAQKLVSAAEAIDVLKKVGKTTETSKAGN